MKTYLAVQRLDATCPVCSTLFEGLTVAIDENGYYIELDTVPCEDNECSTRLCACCPQFTCACCGLTFCMHHIGREEDPECTCVQTDVDQFDATYCDAHGTRSPHPVLLCRVCASPEEVEDRIEPVTEYGQITDAA